MKSLCTCHMEPDQVTRPIFQWIFFKQLIVFYVMTSAVEGGFMSPMLNSVLVRPLFTSTWPIEAFQDPEWFYVFLQAAQTLDAHYIYVFHDIVSSCRLC